MLDNTHLHITTWVLGIVLFFIALALMKGANAKGAKIVHMILRLMYVLIIFTGGWLFFQFSANDAALYGVKFLLGILVIGFMEMILVRTKKQKSVKVMWILLVIALLGTLYLGFSLPVGFNFLG
ncbi:hypothetical protein JMA_13780 [Jeotgalibacillus malaysiensis]|uniref:UPF0344 protein JMA_13780 n=1 Tax=Jeotgalibacillus malaysiensis TaxID=1508404 RepID=A0A0B5AK09_9BACL|nr:YisL family protein [Jeotgalibacillus malaysiensis]AJD90695.1 hypothetical protein JMA_13780 [Jeotgalibacillus malaysiensis]